MHINARKNEYADALDTLYDETPKAVFAALAVSSLTQGGSWLADAAELVAEEWVALHANGIVQRPSARIRALAAARALRLCHDAGPARGR